ncbi:MAG TPA: UbiA family prenyltransferase [Pseudonocardiaceae bacterium]|nr:UbiA family prenyltransferase [Pseudonocardiaceae bacterium]
MSTVRDLARIHRLEYPLPIHYVCYSIWGACYAVDHPAGLLTVPVLLAFVANLPLPVAMNVLNAVVDVPTDARNPQKSGSAAAITRLGARTALWWAAVEMAFSLVVATVVAVWLRHWLVIAATGGAVALHLLYNVEPVRLKRRGLLNPLTLGASFGFLPCLVSYGAVRAGVAWWAWLVFAGLGISVAGRALWWMVPDRSGDAASGMPTFAVRHGARRAFVVSLLIALPGPVVLAAGLWPSHGPVWAVVGGLAAGVFVVGQFVGLRGTSDRALPSVTRMRRRNMTPMMIANVFLAVLPLAAG